VKELKYVPGGGVSPAIEAVAPRRYMLLPSSAAKAALLQTSEAKNNAMRCFIAFPTPQRVETKMFAFVLQ
jgi:hypothetical protein